MQNNIKALRHARKLTQKDLSEAASISRSLLSEYESGRKFPNTRRLDALARALDVAPSALIADGEEAAPRPLSDQQKELLELTFELSDAGLRFLLSSAKGQLADADPALKEGSADGE